LNVLEPSEELPPELTRIMKKLERGTNIREGYTTRVTSEDIQEIEDIIAGIVQRGTAEEIEIENLRQQIQLRAEPFDRESRERLKDLDVMLLDFELGEPHYLSPNFDGVKDEFQFNTEPFGGEKLDGWKLVILDGRSRVQKTIRNRLVQEDEEIILPERIVWNLVNNVGVTVPDGKYAYQFFTMGKNGRENLRLKGVIIVDTVPPQLDIQVPELMFSPNGDGVKDIVVIQVDAEQKIKWICTITTPDEIVVKTMEWDAAIPAQIEWDGKGENGAVLPEGVYDITISGQDGAGNRTGRTVRGVTLDVRERQATVDIEYPIFSPNDDGLLDKITFFPILSDRNRIDTWDLIVQIEKGDTAKRFRGRRFIPKTVVWDGKPQRGKMTEMYPDGLPSGYYTYFLKVVYRSGVNTYSFKRDLIIDNDPPQIELSVEPTPFSPDGDGKDDFLHIKPLITDLTSIQYWKATVFSAAGTAFKTFIGTDAPAEEISWDGISDTGILVDSGDDYYLEFEATDEGFNKGVGEKIPFSIDILVIPTDRGLKIRVSNVEFGFNNAQLQGGKTFLILDKIVQIFNKYEKYSIRIEGHTDSTGNEDYNLDLSKKRAEAVGVYLVDNGIDPERLQFEGYGERYPVDTNATLEGRRRNRRVEFLLIRK
jgi:outer membrane protein OmpA-like peptidoglycan-associated protein